MMKSTGKGLWLIGAAVMGYAFFVFDPSVPGMGSERIVNLDLQQRQMMLMVVGGLMVLVGALLHALAILLPGRTTHAPTASVANVVEPPRDIAADIAEQRAKLDAFKERVATKG